MSFIYKEAKMNYKNEMRSLGGSDYATLIMVGCRGDDGLVCEPLCFGADGEYKVYIVRDDSVPSHYKIVSIFNHWLKIYDDDGRVFDMSGWEIRVYRAGDFGCVVQILD